MNRRVFIGTLAGGLLATPLAAGAQQAGEILRTGYLATNPTPHFPRAFRQGLRHLTSVTSRVATSQSKTEMPGGSASGSPLFKPPAPSLRGDFLPPARHTVNVIGDPRRC
jgi:hypothetical protein